MGLLDFSLGTIMEGVDNIIDDFHLSDTEKAKMAMQEKELEVKLAQMDTDLASKQIDVNIAEASNPPIFVAGWRPFLGWVGGLALVYKYIFSQIIMYIWCIAIAKEWIPKGTAIPPELDVTALIGFLTILVGARQIDKWRGTDTTGLSK